MGGKSRLYVCLGCKHHKVDCEGDKWYCGKEYYRVIDRIKRGLVMHRRNNASITRTKTIIKCDFKEI